MQLLAVWSQWINKMIKACRRCTHRESISIIFMNAWVEWMPVSESALLWWISVKVCFTFIPCSVSRLRAFNTSTKQWIRNMRRFNCSDRSFPAPALISMQESMSAFAETCLSPVGHLYITHVSTLVTALTGNCIFHNYQGDKRTVSMEMRAKYCF